MQFEEYLYHKIKVAINELDNDVTEDIYAISLYISNIDDDGRLCCMQMGYNTNQQLEDMIEEAYDFNEAKWNYAFWLQNDVVSVGDVYASPSDSEVVTNWIKNLGLYYTDEEEEVDFDRILELSNKIISQFVEVVLSVVSKLHNNEVIRTKFGNDIPIIVHELEYYDEIAVQNKRVNPDECIKDFYKWVKDM